MRQECVLVQAVCQSLKTVSPHWHKLLREGEVIEKGDQYENLYDKRGAVRISRGDHVNEGETLDIASCRRCIVGEAHGFSNDYAHFEIGKCCIFCKSFSTMFAGPFPDKEALIDTINDFCDHLENMCPLRRDS